MLTPANDDRRLHEAERRIGERLARQLKTNAEDRQNDLWHTVATVYRVVGTRGRSRSVIVVGCCPWCRRPHVHTGKPDFTSGKRTASCHQGRYLVHTGVLEGEVAA